MYKFTKKVLFGVLGLSLFNSVAFGIEAEFKNSLMKIELNKANENAYIVNLYTKNNFIEPIKIIKKSDLNYYILLPETKNESTRITGFGTDIRNISTNVYPYAGQDVKNGYVKINIDTTKPLDFKINIKNFESDKKTLNESAIASSEASKANKKEVVTSAQKKNSISSIDKNVQLKPKKPVKKEDSEILTKNTVKIEEAVRQEIERVRQEALIPQQEILEEYEQDFDDAIQENVEENITPTGEELNELKQIAGEEVLQNKKDNCLLRKKIANKLAQYGISLKEFACMLLALLLSLIFMIKVLAKKTIKVGIKNKVDLIEKETRPSFQLRQKEEVKNDGQYFVFDKNVKQIGFCDPALDVVNKNYELSSYEPELKNKYERTENFSNKTNANEYDIIQKILKEDTFIDLPANVSPIKKVNVQKPKIQQQAKIEQSKAKKQEPKQQTTEPQVLSSVEIAPERGFMCVLYNDNISLIGYIFDDVFPLYNFKTQKLENYDIKFRLSEKDDKHAHFIVKIANTKMLIRVSKSQMVMEVLL